MLPKHPLAELFPPMTEEEYGALVEDIGANGLQQKILLYEGAVLDGWHRYRALHELAENGKEFDMDTYAEDHFDVFDGTEEEAAALVWSANLYRRHLNYSQRAALAAEYKERLQASGEKLGATARQLAAMLLQIGERAVDEAAAVKRQDPDLFEMMKDGGASLRDAQRQIAGGQPADEVDKLTRLILLVRRAYALLCETDVPPMLQKSFEGLMKAIENVQEERDNA